MFAVKVQVGQSGGEVGVVDCWHFMREGCRADCGAGATKSRSTMAHWATRNAHKTDRKRRLLCCPRKVRLNGF
jgi:hypothetical protein